MSRLRTAWRWLLAGQLPAHLACWLRLRREVRRLAASPLFDAGWYRCAYPDVGVAPALHYRLRGAAEGRLPGPWFDAEAYLAGHPELCASAANPLLHCLERGGAAAWRRDPAALPRLPRLPLDAAGYARWVAECDTRTDSDHAAMAAANAAMRWRPRFSLVVAAPAASPACDATLASIAAQTYSEWEILPPGGLAEARGDFVLFLTPAVRLAASALFELAAAASADTDLIYADEDQIDAEGRRHSPWFKPGWDPDRLAVEDFLGPACAWRRSRLERLRTVPSLADPGVMALDPGRVRHVCAVLFHRTDPPARARAVTRIHHGVPTPEPLVSILVPTRDRAGLLAKCADGVLHRTGYRNVELLIVDNGSRQRRTRNLLARLRADRRVRVIRHPGAFNWSAMNNAAAAQAQGEVLVLLNNDIEVIDGGWLHELVGQALRPEIGAVGARLLYPDGSLQHAGITLGPAAHSAHPWRHGRDAPEPVAGVAAATGACLALRRAVFFEVGGMETEHLAQTNNDIDLCLRLRARGYRVIVTPHATLLHHEAASRGPDVSGTQLARAAAERDYLVRTWGGLAQADPYLNPNLTVIADRLAFAQPPPPRAWSGFSSPSPSRSSLARPRSA